MSDHVNQFVFSPLFCGEVGVVNVVAVSSVVVVVVVVHSVRSDV